MAGDSKDTLTYYLSIANEHSEQIAPLREIKELLVGHEDNVIWIKNLSIDALNSIAVQSIPYTTKYYSKSNKLFLVNSQLPERNLPNILWTPIERAISIQLPRMNFNFFSIDKQIDIKWCHAEEETEAMAMLCEMNVLRDFIFSAPQIRLSGLKWCIIDQQSLIYGIPMLPIRGKTFWQYQNFLFPIGRTIRYKHLLDSLNKKWGTSSELVLWEENMEPIIIREHIWKPLTRSGFTHTINNLSANHR